MNKTHVGAGVLVMVAGVGKVAIRHTDDILSIGAQATRHGDDLLRVGDDVLRVGGGLGRRGLTHSDEMVTTFLHKNDGLTLVDDVVDYVEYSDELLQSIAEEALQFTAESTLEWIIEWGEPDPTDYSGMWSSTWSDGPEMVHRQCKRSRHEKVWELTCTQRGTEKGTLNYVAVYHAFQGVGSEKVCTKTSGIAALKVSNPQKAEAISAHLNEQLAKGDGCKDRENGALAFNHISERKMK